MSKSSTKRGGARKGAGRPIAPIKRSTVSIRLSDAEKAVAMRLGGSVSKGVQVSIKLSEEK